MKNQLKIISFLLFFPLLSMLFAQNVNIDIANERFLMEKKDASKILANGSPYVNPFFSNIRITSYKDKIYSGRYNAFNGELEVKLEGDRLVALDSKGEFEVTFIDENKTYKSTTYYSNANIPQRGFLLVLSETNNYTLYKKEIIKFYDKVKAATSYQQDVPAVFKREADEYYLKFDDKIFFIPNKKKELLGIFPKEAKNIKAFLKKNKLNPKDEADLIKIVDHIATLNK